MTAVAAAQDRLQGELDLRHPRLRPPSVVMQPAMMGAARLTRYSFSRTMLRRAAPRFSDLSVDASDDWVLPTRAGRLA